MVVVVLGTVASASTWAFNVVRSLVAQKYPEASSTFAERGGDLVPKIPDGCRHLIIKAHSLNSEMINVLTLFNAKIVFTDRNPLDVVVSQHDRFGWPLRQTVIALCGTYVSAAMLRSSFPLLHIQYEAGLTSKVESISSIADFLDLAISDEIAHQIFFEHQAEVIKAKIGAWSEGTLGPHNATGPSGTWHEPTHWHPNHIGDGVIGKGNSRLSEAERFVVNSACAIWAKMERWSEHILIWPAQLFCFSEPRVPGVIEQISLGPEEKTPVWGPYIALPAGRWTMRPLVSSGGESPVVFKVDACVTSSKRNVLAMRVCCASRDAENDLSLTFTHVDHSEPVEIRFSSVMDSNGILLFRGVELRYQGPPEYRTSRGSQLASETLGRS